MTITDVQAERLEAVLERIADELLEMVARVGRQTEQLDDLVTEMQGDR